MVVLGRYGIMVVVHSVVVCYLTWGQFSMAVIRRLMSPLGRNGELWDRLQCSPISPCTCGIVASRCERRYVETSYAGRTTRRAYRAPYVLPLAT